VSLWIIVRRKINFGGWEKEDEPEGILYLWYEKVN
jgi:hypothetical protein